MLDFLSLHPQLVQMGQAQRSTHDALRDRLREGLRVLNSQRLSWQKEARKLGMSRTSWLLAHPLEDPATRYRPTPRPTEVTVAATDGSQVFPDRNFGATCYLLNVSQLAFQYGTAEPPILRATPTLHHTPEDLSVTWDGREMPVTAEIIGALRDQKELDALLAVAREARRPERPVVALADGTLIRWSLGKGAEDFKDAMLARYAATLAEFEADRIPVASYISAPGSTDVVNALRVALCPDPVANCDRCPYRDHDPVPSSVLDGLTDRILFEHHLERPGERSALFRSASQVLDAYGERQTILFFYVHVGREVGRVELPAWVATDGRWVDLIHSVVLDQADKGQGYPLILSEAHERAVVRGPEREQFYGMLQSALIRAGVKVQRSEKSLLKRSPRI